MPSALLTRGPALLGRLASQRASSTLVGQCNAAVRLLTTGSQDQHPAGDGRIAALALVGAGAVALSSSQVGASADAPPAQVAGDPYARPAEPRPLPSRITLYQYEVCPYCCKVRAMLDYFKLPYTVVEVNPLTKGELKWSSYKKVPVVQLDDEVVLDSSAIMSRLAVDVAAARSQPAAPAAPEPAATEVPAAPEPVAAPRKAGFWASMFGGGASSSGKVDLSKGSSGGAAGAGKAEVPGSGVSVSVGREGVGAAATAALATSLEDEVRWRKWVDQRLVKVITANIYRNWDESVDTFKYVTDQTGWSWGTREVARWAGAVIMWRIGKGLPAKYGIEGDLRQALYETANDFVDNALRGRRFAGGDAPDLADLAAFGVIRAVRQTGAFRDLMEHSRLAPWFAAMEAAVGDSARLA